MLNEQTQSWLLPRGDSFRISIWTTTLQRVAEQPWVGLGILTSDDVVTGNLLLQHPHNLYLAVLFQGGVVALFLYLMVLWKSLVELSKNYAESDSKLALSILAIAGFAHLLDEHELIDKVGAVWILIWLPVAVALGNQWKSPAKRAIRG